MKTILKYCFYCFLAFISYKGLNYYALFSSAKKMTSVCGLTREAMDDLKKRRAPNWEVEKFMHDKYSCLKENQNFIENFYFPVPDNWINPPPGSVTYEDIHRNRKN